MDVDLDELFLPSRRLALNLSDDAGVQPGGSTGQPSDHPPACHKGSCILPGQPQPQGSSTAVHDSEPYPGTSRAPARKCHDSAVYCRASLYSQPFRQACLPPSLRQPQHNLENQCGINIAAEEAVCWKTQQGGTSAQALATTQPPQQHVLCSCAEPVHPSNKPAAAAGGTTCPSQPVAATGVMLAPFQPGVEARRVHLSLYKRYKQAAAAQVEGVISSLSHPCSCHPGRKSADMLCQQGQTLLSGSSSFQDDPQHAVPVQAASQPVYVGSRVGVDGKASRGACSKATLYSSIRHDHFRALQHMKSGKARVLPRATVQPVAVGQHAGRVNAVQHATSGSTVSQHPYAVQLQRMPCRSTAAAATSHHHSAKAAAGCLEERCALLREPTAYVDHCSSSALSCANTILSCVTLPGGIQFVHLSEDAFIYRLGRTCGFTAMGMALGASYFQRLIHTLPVLALAVKDSYTFQPLAQGLCSERGVPDGPELQSDVNLCSIYFVCMYLAQKVCDEPPPPALLRSVLSSLFGATVGYQQAYAVEAMCLDTLEWRLGPYFHDDDVDEWMRYSTCKGWLPAWIGSSSRSCALEV